MKHQESFEAWWKEQYAWEMKRAVAGRGDYGLKVHNGEYVSDRVRNDYKVWHAAMERMK